MSSSLPAIKTYIESEIKKDFAPHLLRSALKAGVASGKLTLVKASYKLSAAAKKAPKKPKAKKPKAKKPKAAKKPKKPKAKKPKAAKKPKKPKVQKVTFLDPTDSQKLAMLETVRKANDFVDDVRLRRFKPGLSPTGAARDERARVAVLYGAHAHPAQSAHEKPALSR